jgi:hypothetical protein
MEKNARVEVGKTPSVHSGRPSELEQGGEAVCRDELQKKASLTPICELEDPQTHCSNGHDDAMTQGWADLY